MPVSRGALVSPFQFYKDGICTANSQWLAQGPRQGPQWSKKSSSAVWKAIAFPTVLNCEMGGPIQSTAQEERHVESKGTAATYSKGFILSDTQPVTLQWKHGRRIYKAELRKSRGNPRRTSDENFKISF